MKRIMMIIMAVALIALPAMAQQEQWQTSTMQSSGSAYSSQVTPVGATSAPSEATTTTASYAPRRPGSIRRDGFDTNTDPGTVDPGSPIGDAMVPLLLMSVVFGGVIALRRKRNAISK